MYFSTQPEERLATCKDAVNTYRTYEVDGKGFVSVEKKMLANVFSGILLQFYVSVICFTFTSKSATSSMRVEVVGLKGVL